MNILSPKLPVIAAFVLCIASCQPRHDLGKALSREFNNPALRELETADIAPFLEKKLSEQEHTETVKLLAEYYRGRSYAPALLQRYLPGNGTELLLERIGNAGEHGLDPAAFQPGRLRQLMDSLNSREPIAAADAAGLVAELELQLAISLAGYSNALLYGLTDPAEIYPRYSIKTSRPDSASMAKLFSAAKPEAWLDSIQPSRPEYLVLQKELARLNERRPARDSQSGQDTANTQDDLRRTLAVNMERLRWKNKPDTGHYVVVNIAAYRLDVVKNGKSVLDMKVCVGESAQRWQTPQLSSMIERVQVNPVWNIPESIASREIMAHASADPYYLENANIDVYRNGEKIEDSRKIDWDEVTAKNSAYRFKQRPGSQNALGKIKFLFDNQSSVYLHDTPAKAAFDRDIRAVSHGCVRVGKPLELARALFGEGKKFEEIKTEMGKENPQAKNIELPEEVPVFLVYYTCSADQDGRLQMYPDVYGLDELVLRGMNSASTSASGRL